VSPLPTVAELSAPYTNFLINPLAPDAAGVCAVCLTFTDGRATCFPCGKRPRFADAALAVSYSIAFGQLHTALAQYKRRTGPAAAALRLQLAAVLWRFLRAHEPCLARHAGVERFELVTTVPSGHQARDATHPLPRIVGELVGDTRDRYRRLLARSGTAVEPRTVDCGKFNPAEDLAGEAVLLIDDTWTSGASVQSAAGALKTAGAGKVAVLVIGRHVSSEYRDNAARLRALPRGFDWDRCAVHRGNAVPAS
jgi:predicted amidophosphoribosyltransferase